MFSDDCLADMEMPKPGDVLAETFTGVNGQCLGSSHHIEGPRMRRLQRVAAESGTSPTT
jgi:hypothetical protein